MYNHLVEHITLPLVTTEDNVVQMHGSSFQWHTYIHESVGWILYPGLVLNLQSLVKLIDCLGTEKNNPPIVLHLLNPTTAECWPVK